MKPCHTKEFKRYLLWSVRLLAELMALATINHQHKELPDKVHENKELLVWKMLLKYDGRKD